MRDRPARDPGELRWMRAKLIRLKAEAGMKGKRREMIRRLDDQIKALDWALGEAEKLASAQGLLE